MAISLLDVRRLADYMSELSERYWSAGWLIGLEFTLWEALQDGGKFNGSEWLDPVEVVELARLQKACGGWIYWESSDEASVEVLAREVGGRGEMFVTVEEWLPMHARWQEEKKR